MDQTPPRTRYEVLVGRHVSPATLATFPVAAVTTAVPRNTVRRLRVRADRDLAEIVRRLTERHVELLEIRRCPPPLVGDPGQPREQAPSEAGEGLPDGVVPMPPPRSVQDEHPDGDAVAPISLIGPRGEGARRRALLRRRPARP